MGSRRTMARSYSANGRFSYSNGDDAVGISRPGGISYLSNVRPGTRSTLSSVMAQLTEETQPFFEATLKSRAVSNNCNVKFTCAVTGHPTPEILWYKDDKQLDRYCGLPKYEVFRNGQNHSLHIYNCTVDDAAIYQVSAKNSKGIVSCSGVLEVGDMNEFKIHQRYFGKLKQKAENRRRELDGKENQGLEHQEQLRTISPDRTLRKRRSTMDSFITTSFLEMESREVNPEAVAVEAESRLQEKSVGKADEKPVPITNGAVSAMTNGQDISDSGVTRICDSGQKIFTTQQSKSPSVKKKIKISASAKVMRADAPERTPEERRMKVSTSTSTLASTSTSAAQAQPVETKRNVEEVMEVESNVNTSVSDSRNVTGQCQISTKEPLLVDTPSLDGKKCVNGAVRSKKVWPPTAPQSTNHAVPPSEDKSAGKHKKEIKGRKEKESLEMQKQTHSSSTQRQSVPAKTSTQQPFSTVTKDISKPEDAAKHRQLAPPTRKAEKEVVTVTGSGTANAPCERKNTFPPQPPPRKRAADQPSKKETSPSLKNASTPQPGPQSEVTRARTTMGQNDAPVNLEPPPAQRTIDKSPPQKTPSKSKTTIDDTQTRMPPSTTEAAVDKMTQDIWDHSRGSNGSHAIHSTDLQKSPLGSSGDGEKNQGCCVSPTTQQSQVDTAKRTVEVAEIQVDEKVEDNKVGRSLVGAESLPPNENPVKMAVDVVTEDIRGKAERDEIRTSVQRDAGVTTANVCKEPKKNEAEIQTADETHSKLQNLRPTHFETPIPPITQHQEIKSINNTNLSEQQIKSYAEIPSPVAKVISIAELLRSQLKALESTAAISELALFSQCLTAERCPQSTDEDSKGKLEPHIPIASIRATLMEVFNQLNQTVQEQMQVLDRTSPNMEDLQKPTAIPAIPVADGFVGTEEPTKPVGNVQNDDESVMDTGQDSGALALDHMKERSGTDDVRMSPVSPIAPTEEMTNGSEANSKQTVSVSQEHETQQTDLVTEKDAAPLPPLQDSSEKSEIAALENSYEEHVQGKDIGFKEDIATTIAPVIQDNPVSSESTQNVSKLPIKSGTSEEIHGLNPPVTQPESSMVEETLKTDASSSNMEASPLLKKRNVSPIPSATPQELASGARRKIPIPKAEAEEAAEPSLPERNQAQKKEASPQMSPSLSQRSPLLQPGGEMDRPAEKRSPLLSRRRMTPETPAPSQQPTEEICITKNEEKPAEKDKHDPFKAPQVIRKIRGESYSDASGHLKLWCQFFNVLSDCTIKWYRDEAEIAHVNRDGTDETPVNLAIVQASAVDCGVYGCTITNEYGTDTTDFLLSADILAGMFLREDLGVGEEVEMMPLMFSRGVADAGVWGSKFFGRIMMQQSRIGDGCSHKAWRAKVIYGLEPVFESGNTCIIKACSPITYGGKGENNLIERNLEITKEQCRFQNMAREYCKIFTAEARVIENFGLTLEVIPVYMMYRPANTVPYTTVETDLQGVYVKYCALDHTGRLVMRSGSEVEQKCCTLQHWIFQWTSGNLLLTHLEGVDNKLTSVGISVKATGYQGLSVAGNPNVFEQFVSQHRCNYFCGLLTLRSLKLIDSLMTPSKPKASRSPLLQRKMAAGSSSPQAGRKAGSSPRLPRKAEQEGSKSPDKPKADDAPKDVDINEQK
ncbi:alpha-protein kinase 3 [Genypterus blacodes]|uniref:alpha-protein kinase 3 n=1 Tax=Genypterus blacodes TaxID=154954 RepID=UPI003F767BA7